MSTDQIFNSNSSEEEQWLPLSDLMAGLMVLFLFIAIYYILQFVRPIQETRGLIYENLHKEFKDDLKEWNAEIERETLTIRFKEPEVLFNKGKATLKRRFKIIIRNFFPRYIQVIHSKHREDIAEIRIEGHTSSEWDGVCEFGNPYFCNMKLSQDRARTVLEYAYRVPLIVRYQDWLKDNFTANGLSSSRPLDKQGRLLKKSKYQKEDRANSRRVEFRLRTNIEEKIAKTIRESGQK